MTRRREAEGPLSVAFYLPQYHPIPENDRWWGEGFTDWDNVARAEPLYPGHQQPDLPGELGRYSPLDPAVRRRQADLAQQGGIDAFCYYHYWFTGERLLERPVNEILTQGAPDMPFCLCWANESWTREWSGSGAILKEQRYSEVDDRSHARWLATAFSDERYLRLGGRAVMLVYRAWDLPDPRRTASIWREMARSQGAGELLLCAVSSSGSRRRDPRRLGFDAAVEFTPDWNTVRPPMWRSAPAKLARALRVPMDLSPRFTRIEYDRIIQASMARPRNPFPSFPCVFPDWDNSPRRQRNAVIVDNSTPDKYRQWVESELETSPPLLFVNAWNEWAEGCHLEPGRRWGRAYLEAHARAVGKVGDAEVELE